MPTRPTTIPSWATDANFPAGVDDWSGTPTKVEPSAGKKATGQVPKTAFPSPEYNWLLNNKSAFIAYLDGLAPVFGGGTDGAATLDGATDHNSFSSRSGSIYTLTRDVFSSDLTINTGVTLIARGFRVFVRGTLTTVGTGLIHVDGAPGTIGIVGAGQPGGSPYTAGTTSNAFGGGVAGNGGNTGGSTGTSATTSFGGAGGAGGTGGGAGGGGGTSTAPTAAQGRPDNFSAAVAGSIIGSAGIVAIRGGAGGGGGGGGGGQAGGSGGAGGGILVVAARVMSLAGASAFRAAGGAGGPAEAFSAGANAAGGGGGGGGCAIIAYFSSNVSFSAATNAPGGVGGAGNGGGAADGAVGSNGTLFDLKLGS